MVVPDRLRATPPLVAGLLIACLPATDVLAATFTVNSQVDVVDASPGDGICRTTPANTVCTLRAAIMETNALPGMDVINLPAGTYLLTRTGADDTGENGDLDVLDRLTIIGVAGSTIIDANGPATGDRAMDIFRCIGDADPVGACTGGSVLVDIQGVAFRNGRSANDFGGGIRAQGEVSLENCAITGNMAEFGGGLSVVSAPTTLTGCTISGNTTLNVGGGIFVESFGTLTAVNTTISGNFSAEMGGGLGAYSDTTTVLYNVTITGNYANSDDFETGLGGGIYSSGEVITLYNSIVTENYHGNQGTVFDTSDDCAGPLASAGYNIVTQVTDGQCTVSGSYSSAITSIGLLQDNGGPTPTHALPAGSAAIDAGNPSGCTNEFGEILDTDQRGEPRPFGSACDLGAFERGDTVFKDGFES